MQPNLILHFESTLKNGIYLLTPSKIFKIFFFHLKSSLVLWFRIDSDVDVYMLQLYTCTHIYYITIAQAQYILLKDTTLNKKMCFIGLSMAFCWQYSFQRFLLIFISKKKCHNGLFSNNGSVGI